MGTACICIRKGRKILFGKRGKIRILFCELKKAVCQKGFPDAALAIGALCSYKNLLTALGDIEIKNAI